MRLSGKLLEIDEEINEVDRPYYREALTDRSVTAERLSWLLREMGFTVSASTIRTYRREAARWQKSHD